MTRRAPCRECDGAGHFVLPNGERRNCFRCATTGEEMTDDEWWARLTRGEQEP